MSVVVGAAVGWAVGAVIGWAVEPAESSVVAEQVPRMVMVTLPSEKSPVMTFPA